MMLMTSHRQTYLFGRSYKGASVDMLISGCYDVALLAPSWDRRCVCITEADSISIDTAIVLRFTTKDPFGYQIAHADKILRYLAPRSKHVIQIEGDSVDLEVMWKKIEVAFAEALARKRSGLRALVDLSTCPRYYSLGVVASLIRSAAANKITVFYSEGNYTNDTPPHPLDYPFSVGQWKAVAVPGLLGAADPLKRRFFVVSIGFEGNKTVRVLAREDPERISILLPDPGTKPEYVEKTLERNREVIEYFKVPDQQIVRASAADAIAAWKALAEAALERESESVYYLCSGTKPHALAFALRGLCLDFPTVLYNLPERHSFVDVQPSGTFWRYEIEDVSALPGS